MLGKWFIYIEQTDLQNNFVPTVSVSVFLFLFCFKFISAYFIMYAVSFHSAFQAVVQKFLRKFWSILRALLLFVNLTYFLSKHG